MNKNIIKVCSLLFGFCTITVALYGACNGGCNVEEAKNLAEERIKLEDEKLKFAQERADEAEKKADEAEKKAAEERKKVEEEKDKVEELKEKKEEEGKEGHAEEGIEDENQAAIAELLKSLEREGQEEVA